MAVNLIPDQRNQKVDKEIEMEDGSSRWGQLIYSTLSSQPLFVVCSDSV